MESAGAQQNAHSENAFVRRIFDKKTGRGLLCRYREGETPAQTFGLSWWSEDCISYDEVMRQAVEALREEQRQAIRAEGMLNSVEAAREKAARLEILSRQARAVFDEIAEIEAPDLEWYRMMEQGTMAEAAYREKQALVRQQILEKEPVFSEMIEQMKQLNKVFDKRNPWIRLYADIEIPEVLSREQARKWIARLTVENMETVELEIPEKYARWKAQLPNEWMEGI